MEIKIPVKTPSTLDLKILAKRALLIKLVANPDAFYNNLIDRLKQAAEQAKPRSAEAMLDDILSEIESLNQFEAVKYNLSKLKLEQLKKLDLVGKLEDMLETQKMRIYTSNSLGKIGLNLQVSARISPKSIIKYPMGGYQTSFATVPRVFDPIEYKEELIMYRKSNNIEYYSLSRKGHLITKKIFPHSKDWIYNQIDSDGTGKPADEEEIALIETEIAAYSNKG